MKVSGVAFLSCLVTFSGLSGYRLTGPKMTFPPCLKFLAPGDLCFQTVLEWGPEIQWQRKEVGVLTGISLVEDLAWMTARRR